MRDIISLNGMNSTQFSRQQ